MEIYKKIHNLIMPETSLVQRLSDGAFIPFSPTNTDYQHFKAQILASEAELEDVDGNLMTPEDAKSYVETLP